MSIDSGAKAVHDARLCAMKRRLRSLLLSSSTLSVLLLAPRIEAQDISTVLMNSTFEILGPSQQTGSTSFGTVVIMAKPFTAINGYLVLITATHVMQGISGDNATLMLRRQKEDGSFETLPYPIKIRNNGINLYVSNAEADVSAMYLSLPKTISIKPMSTGALVDDARIQNLELRPGDELLCLGFPLNISLNSFPVLRSGLLASYPLTPSRVVKKYYYNFHVFPGNRGGPVYFDYANRMIEGNNMAIGGRQQGVLGLVVQQLSSPDPTFKNDPLDVSIVVPSTFILDTLKLLPETPTVIAK